MSHGEVCCKSGTIITRALADLLLAYVAQAFLLFHGQRDTDAEVKYNYSNGLYTGQILGTLLIFDIWTHQQIAKPHTYFCCKTQTVQLLWA